MDAKKIISGALAATMALGFNVFAAGDEQTETTASENTPVTDGAVDFTLPKAQETYYDSFTGKVTEIRPFMIDEETESEDTFYVFVQNEDEMLMNFVVSGDTYMLTEEKLEVGAEVTGFYLSGNVPMIMIYPQQVSAKALSVKGENTPVAIVDRFDENMLNAKADAVAVIGEDVEIVDVNGDPYEGELAGKVLAIYSTVTMESFPAQVVADKVVVLSDEVIPGEGETKEEDANLTEEEIAYLKENVPTFGFVVENETIEATAAYADDNGTVMVPLRAVAEALGYEVTWVHESKSVILNNSVTLWIGQDAYAIGRAAAVEIGTAPELVNGTTFVPLNFFADILDKTAKISEGNIVITTPEAAE